MWNWEVSIIMFVQEADMLSIRYKKEAIVITIYYTSLLVSQGQYKMFQKLLYGQITGQGFEC